MATNIHKPDGTETHSALPSLGADLQLRLPLIGAHGVLISVENCALSVSNPRASEEAQAKARVEREKKDEESWQLN